MGSSPAGGTKYKHIEGAQPARFFLIQDGLQMVFPVDMSLHRKSRRFDIAFDDGQSFSFSIEFLRVFSPSAEVTGHTPDQAKLQVGKRDVDVTSVEPVGRYAIRFVFDDGHDSGIYSWEYLHDIGMRQQQLWEGYLQQLKDAGASRDPADPANVPFMPKPKATCPSKKH